jgi:hypothetical protein
MRTFKSLTLVQVKTNATLDYICLGLSPRSWLLLNGKLDLQAHLKPWSQLLGWMLVEKAGLSQAGSFQLLGFLTPCGRWDAGGSGCSWNAYHHLLVLAVGRPVPICWFFHLGDLSPSVGSSIWEGLAQPVDSCSWKVCPVPPVVSCSWKACPQLLVLAVGWPVRICWFLQFDGLSPPVGSCSWKAWPHLLVLTVGRPGPICWFLQLGLHTFFKYPVLSSVQTTKNPEICCRKLSEKKFTGKNT